jgi:hypothetical protein
LPCFIAASAAGKCRARASTNPIASSADAHAVGAGRIHDDDATGAGGGDVHVIHSSARARDGTQAWCGVDQRGGDFGGAANDERVGGFQIVSERLGSAARTRVNLPAFGAQEIDGRRGQIVGDNYSHRVADYTCRLVSAELPPLSTPISINSNDEDMTVAQRWCKPLKLSGSRAHGRVGTSFSTGFPQKLWRLGSSIEGHCPNEILMRLQ